MSLNKTLGLAFISAVLSAPAVAATIDFAAYADGTAITTIGSTTFTLAGGGETGNPTVADLGGIKYLWNSSDSINYPTNEILRVAFGTPVNNLKFDFNPFGLNGDPDQGWSLYDSASALIASGSFSSSGFASYDLSAYSGVARLELHNGRNDWLQGLASVSFDPIAVPAPATPALLIAAVLAMAAVRRSRVR